MTPPTSLVFRRELHGTVGSTNDLARDAAGRGEPEGLWVVARRQTAGRGRHGRSWESPEGNLYGSLLLRPERPLQELATLSLVMALAVAEATEALSLGSLRPRVKWPNDVLIGGAKFSGILLESGNDGRTGSFLIAGLGVNLCHHPADPSRPSTSLTAEGCEGIGVERFLTALEPPLEALYRTWQQDGFASLRERWLARAAGLGEEVGFRAGPTARTGRFVDLGADGTLKLADAAGRVESLAAGELFFGPGR